jgi:excisionase family DNA binding protein
MTATARNRMRLDEAPDVMRVDDVARVLGIGLTTAYEAVRCGQIPSVRVGRRFLVPKAALARLLAVRDPQEASS